MVTVTTANLLALATSLPYVNQLQSLAQTRNATVNFVAYHEFFVKDVLGPNPGVEQLATESYNAFHESGVYYAPTNSSYISSNFDSLSNPINTTIYNYTTGTISTERFPNLNAANGGTLFVAPDNSGPDTNGLEPAKRYYLACDEGTFEGASQLLAIDPVAKTSVPVVTNFRGRNFSSLNDVKQHPRTGDLFFTDADYGYFQHFRPKRNIPLNVYRFNPSTGDLQVVANGFEQPNGIELSPDTRTLYVTDTSAMRFSTNYTRQATVYALPLSEDGRRVGPRRVFAMFDTGIPDGIHTDVKGYVYAAGGSGDGIHVFDPDGTLIGKMLVEGGSNNFEFIKGGMLIFNAERLWRVDIKAVGREVDREYNWT